MELGEMLGSQNAKSHIGSRPMRDPAAGERAKRVVRLMGYANGRQFALDAGIGYVTWNRIESGDPMSISVYLKVARKCPGVTYDWLRFGNPAGLPLNIAKALGELP